MHSRNISKRRLPPPWRISPCARVTASSHARLLVGRHHCRVLVGALVGGGILLGLLTRPAALVTTLTMLVALFVVHWTNGPFISNNGYEYALVQLIANLVLLLKARAAIRLAASSKEHCIQLTEDNTWEF
jgi:uncharacterized membrane protein YphA (DoxX/SURF4 family)